MIESCFHLTHLRHKRSVPGRAIQQNLPDVSQRGRRILRPPSILNSHHRRLDLHSRLKLAEVELGDGWVAERDEAHAHGPARRINGQVLNDAGDKLLRYFEVGVVDERSVVEHEYDVSTQPTACGKRAY